MMHVLLNLFILSVLVQAVSPLHGILMDGRPVVVHTDGSHGGTSDLSAAQDNTYLSRLPWSMPVSAATSDPREGGLSLTPHPKGEDLPTAGWRGEGWRSSQSESRQQVTNLNQEQMGRSMIEVAPLPPNTASPTLSPPPVHEHLTGGGYTGHRRILTRPLDHLSLDEDGMPIKNKEGETDAFFGSEYPLMYITSAFLGVVGEVCSLTQGRAR